MNPLEAKEKYGATHYSVMGDGVTPQMYYKKETTPLNDGASFTCWVYLSFANLWMGSNLKVGSPAEADLKEITTTKTEGI